MSPPAESGRVAATKAALLRSTVALLTEVGYQQTHMADVARRAGRAPATAYVHFPTKNYLVGCAVQPVFAPLLASGDAAAAAGGPYLPALKSFVHELVTTARAHQALTTALLEAVQDQTVRSAAPQPPYDPRLAVPLPLPMIALLTSAQRAREIAHNVPVADVGAYATNALMLRILTRPHEPAAATEKLALALLLPALTDETVW